MVKIDLYPREGLVYPNHCLDNWHNNQGSLKDYSDYHYKLALQSADAHIKYGLFTGYDQAFKPSEWMDGMKVLFLIIKDPKGIKIEIKWHDTYQTGKWFEKHADGGWSPIVFKFPKLYQLDETGLNKIIDVIYSWQLDSWAESGKSNTEQPDKWDVEYAIKKFNLKPVERE